MISIDVILETRIDFYTYAPQTKILEDAGGLHKFAGGIRKYLN
jgi:hypothetical protein